MEDELADQIR
jgi:hypothetical protein